VSKTLDCTNFRNYHYDRERQEYRATVDVQGHYGLYRFPKVRVEDVYRSVENRVWRFVRNDKFAPMQVCLLEDRHNGKKS
jgi:hypothetical protein